MPGRAARQRKAKVLWRRRKIVRARAHLRQAAEEGGRPGAKIDGRRTSSCAEMGAARKWAGQRTIEGKGRRNLAAHLKVCKTVWKSDGVICMESKDSTELKPNGKAKMPRQTMATSEIWKHCKKTNKRQTNRRTRKCVALFGITVAKRADIGDGTEIWRHLATGKQTTGRAAWAQTRRETNTLVRRGVLVALVAAANRRRQITYGAARGTRVDVGGGSLFQRRHLGVMARRCAGVVAAHRVSAMVSAKCKMRGAKSEGAMKATLKTAGASRNKTMKPMAWCDSTFSQANSVKCWRLKAGEVTVRWQRQKR